MRDVSLFDRVAPVYDLLAPSPDRQALREGLALAERPVERVLDVAGGSGRVVRGLEGVEGVVVDAAPGMVRTARRRGTAAVAGDAARLPFRDRTFDAVLVVDALHHVADSTGALREAARVLRAGGVVVVREFDPTTLRGRALVAAEHALGFDSEFVPPETLAEAMTAAGLRASVPRRGFGYTAVGVRVGETEPGEP